MPLLMPGLLKVFDGAIYTIHAHLMRLRNVGSACNRFMVSRVLSIETRKTTKDADMETLVLSTLLFQAVATVALVTGAAASTFFPARREPG